MVPGALLEMIRGVMRTTFSSLISKPVYTFLFDRSDEVGEELHKKLVKARDSNAVVVTNPTSIKSFMLKFIEILEHLELNRMTRHGGGVGMRLEEFREEEAWVKAKLVGIQGRWEDAAAQMWATEMKRLGLEPFRDDPEWNMATDSKGTRLYGTKRMLLGGVWLKFLKPSNWNADQVELLCNLRQIAPIKSVLTLFRDGVLLLDEVDLLLHPLKSELNWPLGPKEALDLTLAPKDSPVGEDGTKRWVGLRWQLSLHLIDALLYCSTRRTTADFADNANAGRALRGLHAAFEAGRQAKAIQATPHLVVLDRAYYDSTLRPLFAQWILVWLSDKGISGLTHAHILEYMERSAAASPEALAEVQRHCSDDSLKLLNLAHTLLSSILPHVLGKIHRVGFGLLDDEHLRSHRAEPASRRLLAVPFVGKDVPSAHSEFSHPDVAILLTAAAYRHEGLRREDFAQLLRMQAGLVAREVGKVASRPSSLRWQLWVRLAGGRVRGTAAAGPGRGDSDAGDTRLLPNRLHPSAPADPPPPGVDPDLLDSLWPLHLVDLKDRDQFEVLYSVLRRLPQAIEWHLTNSVFPVTMRFQRRRLSASGQELGGDLLFGRRLGFSGTPADLLPAELGRPRFERGDDGRVLRTLTRPAAVSLDLLGPGWSALGVLDRVAAADPPYHALIDAGALVTGLDNLGVARYLLRRGLRGSGPNQTPSPSPRLAADASMRRCAAPASRPFAPAAPAAEETLIDARPVTPRPLTTRACRHPPFPPLPPGPQSQHPPKPGDGDGGGGGGARCRRGRRRGPPRVPL